MQSFPDSDTPSPESEFPYDRIASTFARNTTMSYVYHQSSDSEITEDVWHDEKGAWTSDSFTIETS